MFQTTFEEVKELVLAESFLDDLKTFFSAGWRILTVISTVIFITVSAVYQVSKPKAIWLWSQIQTNWNKLTSKITKGEVDNDFSTSVLSPQKESNLQDTIHKVRSITQYSDS